MENPPALPSPEPEPETEVSQAPPRRLLRLRCAVQHYEWGQRGAASLVARLADHNNPDPARPYAELWMGTHPSGPSSLVDDGSLLRDWLARNHDALGPAVAARWGGDLPFLFKVLSVAKALSIQAHPDKKLAEVLHALRPSTYKDENHKPEMAIAITEFRALCGFAGIEVSLLRKEMRKIMCINNVNCVCYLKSGKQIGMELTS
ncbi:Mannose-6-phosphate isomerase 1 [Zea mays]|uniref:mannose-6-phosphate isomerase n=1 Tax=Zea mays TaxID=4577 RepID=A0A1D6FDS4_MAIZE|nr:Mannose-6-phosphate isomerase 1 [Zea mays]